VLYVTLNKELQEKKDAARNEVLNLPGVEEVSFSQFLIGAGDRFMSWGRSDEDHVIEQMAVFPVDWRYLSTMGVRLVEGRDFNEYDHEALIINEAGRRMWDWVELDKPLLHDMGKVVGVCSDFRFSTTRADRTQKPMAFLVYSDSDTNYGPFRYMNMRVGAGTDKVKLRSAIRDALRSLGMEEVPEVRFIDQDLEVTYQEEFRFIRQVLVFSVICLIITLIGVFCLTLFETEYRRKEIGIRKVFGSTEEAILLLLSRRYAALLLFSFLFAAPLAWHIGRQWLMSFAERTPIYWWLFPVALIAVSAITLATVCIQGWRAATENPVNSIKTE
jgi:putative ABC transport system permease protein